MCQGYAFAQVNPPMESTLAYNCSRLLTGVGATHNPEVVGSNPAPATNYTDSDLQKQVRVFCYGGTVFGCVPKYGGITGEFPA